MATLPRDQAPSASSGDSNSETVRGIVGAVAAMHRGAEPRGRHADIVGRVFGPGSDPAAGAPAASRAEPAASGPGVLRYPEIDVDFSLGEIARRRASVLGAASKVAGDLVADENLMIEGFVAGGVRARRSRVTLAREGLVQGRIEARSVRILGTVRGDVVSEDWVEVKPGGVIHGDVRAPRVILHDGALVTGRLEMETAEASRRSTGHFDPLVVPPRPGMRKVERPRSSSQPGVRG
jgi:cytoskeletal protein CcmA (bactofilin family)